MTQPTTFEEAGVGADLSATLAQRDIIAPFPVQQMVIPLALAGAILLGLIPAATP